MFAGASYSATAKTDTVTVTLPGGFVDSNNTSFALVFVKQLSAGAAIVARCD
jgi:hypothetical protein